MLVDSHCHLDRLKIENLDDTAMQQVINDAHAEGVEHILCVGIDMNNAPVVKGIAEKFEQVYASVGVHPLDAESMISADTLIQAADHPKVVAIGETGLDYYYSKDNAAVQQENLVMHLQVAKQLDLPVIIHTRDAKQDTLDLLKQDACRERAGVLHCFTEDWDMAKQAIDLGFYISFSGIITFKNAQELKDVAKKVPLENMLVETDAPYLTPVPFRGKPNYPKHTRQVAEYIAELKQVPFEDVAKQTTDNFFKLFNKASKVSIG